MPCESCAIQFSVFKRKRVCSECDRLYCSGCLRRGGGTMCAPCRLLSTRPLTRQNIANLKVRDLQCFLQRQNVSTRGCVEKEELVSLCVSHVNSASYRRRGGARGAGAFSSLKGITNNINEFINSAFDIRTAPPPQAQPPPQPPPSCGGCFNYNNVQPPPGGAAPQPARPERFTTTPGGQRDIFVPVPAAAPSPAQSPTDGTPVETADCFEIEDLDDAGWEFVMRPADPLPNDSEVLMSSPECSAGGATGPRPEPRPPPAAPPPADISPPPAAAAAPPRAAWPAACRPSADAASGSPLSARSASELELRPGAARGEPASLPEDGGRELDVRLEDIASEAELEALSVRQLKALLVRGCVAYRGCVERGELVALAARLWRARDAAADTCRICMAAPLDCVLLECGHVVACAACARRLPECPLCRAYVVRAVRIFRS